MAYDVTPLISGRTGIARYVEQLDEALVERGAGLHRFAVGRSSFPVPHGVRHLGVPARLVARTWRTLGWPPVERLTPGIDLVHATGMLVPATRRPLVVTVHDVAAIHLPDLHPPRHRDQQLRLVRDLHRAAVVVTVSAATADDVAHLGIETERIVVAPLGVRELPPAERATAPPPGYLLTVGESSPRKRLSLVLEALARLDAGPRLVMAGPPAADERHLASLVADRRLGERVMRIGAVTDAELAALYAGAVALCFPSASEGFGLPVLEAMAAGVPVIAADLPVLREVAGDAALFVGRADADAWAQAIESVLGDPALRDRLAEEGRRRAGEFTWRRTAESTMDAYQMALESVARAPA